MIGMLWRTVAVYGAAVAAMRLMGKRQLGELQPGELVTTILVSNVATICIDDPNLPLLASLGTIALLAALEILNSTLAWRFPRYAQLLYGRPVTVIRNGRILQKSLPLLRISAQDLAEALRGQNIGSPGQVLWGVMEPSGKLNAVPCPRPGEPQPYLPLLLDGVLYRESLQVFDKDEAWLTGQLQKHGWHRERMLALLYNGSEFWAAEKEERGLP